MFSLGDSVATSDAGYNPQEVKERLDAESTLPRPSSRSEPPELKLSTVAQRRSMATFQDDFFNNIVRQPTAPPRVHYGRVFSCSRARRLFKDGVAAAES
jgi:hypothetical protein